MLFRKRLLEHAILKDCGRFAFRGGEASEIMSDFGDDRQLAGNDSLPQNGSERDGRVLPCIVLAADQQKLNVVFPNPCMVHFEKVIGVILANENWVGSQVPFQDV